MLAKTINYYLTITMKKFYLMLFAAALLASCSSGGDDSQKTADSSFDITAITVKNAEGNTPVKGDEVTVSFTIKNTGDVAGKASIAAKLSSSRFSDYKNVNLPTVDKQLAAGETAVVTMEMGPFFQDSYNGKHYALGRGEYFFESVMINEATDTEYSGRVFQVQTSNALLVPVIYEPQYLAKIETNLGIKDYLKNAFTRQVELYDNNGNYQDYAGGFDDMMNVEHHFYPILTTNVSDYPLDDGLCEKAIALGGDVLGLKDDWVGPTGTQAENHGFDYLMALTADGFGGVACGWINVQISGVFDYDKSQDRAQIVLIHETSHLFGSPHCDPKQGYVMCSGEKHSKYIDKGIYVYNVDSKNQMSMRWD